MFYQVNIVFFNMPLKESFRICDWHFFGFILHLKIPHVKYYRIFTDFFLFILNIDPVPCYLHDNCGSHCQCFVLCRYSDSWICWFGLETSGSCTRRHHGSTSPTCRLREGPSNLKETPRESRSSVNHGKEWTAFNEVYWCYPYYSTSVYLGFA